jgi:hypothetical protein
VVVVRIQLEDNVAAALMDRARARGQSLEEFLAELTTAEQHASARRLTGEEVIRLIEAEAESGNSTYQGSYSREDIYFDHD